MKTYTVWYRKEPTYWFDNGLKVEDISSACFKVSQIKAGCLDEVFQNQQAEVWSPKAEREMTDVIKKSLGSRDTSMSVGDIAEVNGKYYQVDLSCWRQVN
jgi:hypothetical protein